MFKVGNHVVYKKEICRIIEIKKNRANNSNYYILVPISNDSLKIEVPVANLWGSLRPLISKKEIEKIINEIPNIEILVMDGHLIEKEYKLLINSGKPEDFIKIIKTAYFKDKEKSNKITTSRDTNYFNLAEKYLYEEFSIVLGMNYEDTKNFIIKCIEQNK